jgi:(E)-4-hydroxy-3-methylbut-2-enyl-diphosphate synthase
MSGRRVSRAIKVGAVWVGGGHPVVVQSMTNTDTRDVAATVGQIRQLEQAGCRIVRLAVVDAAAAAAIRALKSQTSAPLIADIHFDHQLALAAIAAGADGLRINPGNIGSVHKVREVVSACQDRGIPIRIGVNAGSLGPEVLRRYGGVCAPAMVDSALEHVRVLEALKFDQIKLSLKSSSVNMTIAAYELIAGQVDYPLHLGITEAGTLERSLIKTALAFGVLLRQGVGDTIRVSVTGDPVDEVWAGYEILRGLELSQTGAELISCPTCGRCEIDLVPLAQAVDRYLRRVSAPIKVAVMCCVVNGPGEAREADIGIAGGRGQVLLFKQGEPFRKVAEEQALPVLIDEINRLIKEKGGYSA